MNKTTPLILSLVALFFAGCVTSFKYPSEKAYEGPPLGKVTEATIHVASFTDFRETKTSNRIFLSFIPFVPYGYKETSHPEQAHAYCYVNDYFVNVNEDLAKAAFDGLRHAGGFGAVARFDVVHPPKTGYTLSAKVNEFSARTVCTTYCISFDATLLWLIGLPSGTATNCIGIDFELTDNTTEQIIWKKSCYDEDSLVHGFYYNSWRELGMFPAIYRGILADALPELADAVRKHEQQFHKGIDTVQTECD